MPSDIFTALNQRGHRVIAEGSERDIFLPARQDLEQLVIDSFKGVLYSLMRRDSFRRALREWAYGRIANDDPNLIYVKSYEALCQRFGGWNNNPQRIQHRYASTFEWYVTELLCREFAARASGFGLRLQDANPDDEFDCVALLDEGLVFVECKTGAGAIYAEIERFLRRDGELQATYSFFVYDRDYIFSRTGDDVPRLTNTQAHELGVQAINKITVRNHTFFQFVGERQAAGSRYFFACSAFNSFEDRIRYMIRYVNETQNTPVASSLFTFERIPFVNPPPQPDQGDTATEQAAPS
jgi:hypothetical protein